VNDYEKQRAELIAQDFGYVGFAADIFGDVPDVEQRGSELAMVYRNDPALFAARITAAVDTVRQMDQVDGSNIAIIGYCFGGTGVLIYAMLGINGEGVKAVVSFHGGLTQVPGASPNVTAVGPKVLVLSGGDDDASSEIMDLELEMDAANATWEITRYSGIQHAFTVFNDTRYNEWADTRSWRSTHEFLMEAFGDLTYESSPPAALDIIEPVDYVDADGTQLRGYLARPTEPIADGPIPAIVIIPYVVMTTTFSSCCLSYYCATASTNLRHDMSVVIGTGTMNTNSSALPYWPILVTLPLRLTFTAPIYRMICPLNSASI
jgi:dienelactone hydrolase